MRVFHCSKSHSSFPTLMNSFEEFTFISHNKSSHLNLWLWGFLFNHHSNIKSLFCLSHCVHFMDLYNKKLCQFFC